MSVARCREINARLRAAGITVHEWPGWESRGNGLTSRYEGCIVHHTGSGYGVAYQGLITGRPDLAGPLCNYAGNEDGSLTVIAAHPSNHAGASGGRSMGPLPVTTLFNPRVLGLEIVYPGTAPMRPAQYRTACIWARIVTDVLGFGDIQRCRAHGETSVTGKWDPGFAKDRTIDMNRFRTDGLAAVGHHEEDPLSALSDVEQRNLYNRVMGFCRQRWYVWRDGKPVEVPAGTPNAIPAAALDSLDGNFLVRTVQGQINPAQFAQQVASALIPPVVAAVAARASLTPEQVQEATEDAVRAVLGDLVDT